MDISLYSQDLPGTNRVFAENLVGLGVAIQSRKVTRVRGFLYVCM